MAQAASSSMEDKNNQAQGMNVDLFITEIMSDLKANRLELPTLPQLAFKISQVVEDKKANAKDIAKVVSTDPALSARLLQVANSPLVRAAQKIENVQMAVTRMGAQMVRNVVTSFLVRQLFRTKDKTLQTKLLTIWNHSAHVAAISHVLASRYTDIKPDEAMLAGLLHDIGKLPILSKAKDLPNIEANAMTLDKVMQKLHSPLGRVILQTWNFSPYLIEVAAEHENWQRNSEQLDHTDIVLVADIHSHMGKATAKDVDLLQVPAMGKLSLDPVTSIEVLKEANEEIAAIQNLFVS